MKKIYLFMLMAVGLLISSSMSAMPERPVPPEPKAPEGVEIPEHPALPEKGLVKKTFNKVAKAPSKAPMAEGDFFCVNNADGNPYVGPSFYYAVMAAKSYNNPIVLQQKVEEISGCIINANITVDLNGYDLSLDGITIQDGFTLTLQNSQTGPNTVTLNNGEDIYGGVEYSAYAGSIVKAENVTLSITGGEFTATAATALSSYLNLTDNKLVNSYNAKLGVCKRMVANDVQSVCKIGDDEYISLQIALDMARLAGAQTTIDVIADVTESNELYIYDNSDVTLNLNGKTITLSDETSNSFNISYSPEDGYIATLDDKLTINGGEGGKIIATGWNIANKGTLIVDNVALENKASGCVYNEGNVNIVNSSITTPDANDNWAYGIDNEEGVMEITNTNFNCPGDYGIGIYTYSTAENQTATVTGGTINAGYPIYNEGRLTITDAIIEGNYLYSTSYAKVTNITSCTINGIPDIEGGTTIFDDCIIKDWAYVSADTISFKDCSIAIQVQIAGGKVHLEDCTITGTSNSIYLSAGKVDISGCTISGNNAAYVKGGELTINEGCTLTGDTYGIYIYGNSGYCTVDQYGGEVNGDIMVSYRGYYNLYDGTIETISTYNFYAYVTIEGGMVEGNINLCDDGYKGKYNSLTISGDPIIKGVVTPIQGSTNITGGTFYNNQIPVSAGYQLVDQHNGTYVVEKVKEAELNGIQYDYLTEALADANDGEEVKLLIDIVGHDFMVNKAITLDLNGKTIKNDVNLAQRYEINPANIRISANGAVVKNGRLTCCYDYCWLKSGEDKSTIVIFIEENTIGVELQDLMVDGEEGTDKPGWCVMIRENASVKIINGSYIGQYPKVVGVADGGSYTVRGTFANKNIEPNAGWDYQDNGDGTYTLVTSAAKIKGKDVIYHTVAEAFADAQENDLIYLMTTIEEDITITNNVNNLTLDIGNHNIEGKLTVNGSDLKVDGFGTIDDLGGNVKIVRAFTKVNPTGYLAEGSTFEGPNDNLYRVYTDKVVYMDVKNKYYPTLAAALADLPENSTPATVKILLDEQFDFLNSFYKVKQYQNVTIDLNGHKISATTGVKEGSQIFLNNGTLIIDDSSADKNGIISNCAYNADTRAIPGYGSYTIYNTGTLILNNGTIENASSGGACYCVENHYNSDKVSPTFIMNGGKLVQPTSSAVRYYMNGTPYEESTNTVIINGGEIEAAAYGVVIHCSNSSETAPHIVFTMNGGKISSWGHCAFASMATSGTGNNLSNTYITVNGGTLDGSIMVNAKSGSATTRKGKENLSITGGTFLYQPAVDASNAAETFEEFITGGIFANFDSNGYNKFHLDEDNLIAEGYAAVKYDGFGHPETDLIIGTLRKDTIKVEGEKNLGELVPTANDTTEITIVPNTGEDAIINITEDTKINKIEVTSADGKGEAQIVVKEGVTLNVGNGGIVSENDILTTVLVESGGTLIVGTGGIDKEGEATPIEIQASEEKGTGILVFSPNSKAEDTKKYAEVDLYTYCKNVNGKDYWQQFAVPVTKVKNPAGGYKYVTTSVSPMTTYLFDWDYSTYSWHQLSAWGDTPFAGYDMTNISENGGVVYTFKGDLIGNQNKQLTLPHKDYCVMGNSYTAPIDITALFDQINKEMSENTIEKTVYKYDAKAGYYVYTNELEQALDKMGVVKASFTEIKPMEGFLLNLQSGNTAGVMLNYANAVYTPAMTPNTPATAPRMANTDMVLAKISVKSAHAMDQMTLVESDEFSAEIENGKDAFKYLNEGANLYAFDGTNKLAMVATDNLENTMLAFQAAEDEEYTLTFDRALNTNYLLMDMLTGDKVAMVEGNTYTFTATPNTLNPGRFMIVTPAQAPTNMESTKANKAVKGVYTIMGQYLGNGEMWNELPQGVYMINGIKVIK